MALIQCQDCGREVSTLAQACPNCGRPVEIDSVRPDIIAVVATGKRIACPDGSCTGVINESGQCGTCGMQYVWEDEETTGGPPSEKVEIKSPAKKNNGFVPILAVIFLVLWLIGKQGDESKSTSQPIAVDKKQLAMGLVSLDDFRWRKEGFGNVMEADFTIKNMSDYDIKDVEITCTHSGKSGTKIDKNTKTIYEMVGKHDSERLKKFNMGFIHSQAYSTSCEITNLALVSSQGQ